jgi:hypothetical protein
MVSFSKITTAVPATLLALALGAYAQSGTGVTTRYW